MNPILYVVQTSLIFFFHLYMFTHVFGKQKC